MYSVFCQSLLLLIHKFELKITNLMLNNNPYAEQPFVVIR